MFAKGFGLTVVILLAVAILSLPYFLKDNDLPLGRENYYHLRIAENILKEKGLPKYDELSYSGRRDFMSFGWPALIALTSFIFRLPVEVAMNALLFLFGVISIVLFYNILKMFDLTVRFISSLILLISPIFIYLFTIGGKYVVPFVLSLLLTYFILDKKYLKAGIAFIFIPFFDLISAFFIIVMFIGYLLYIKRKKLLLAGLVLLLLVLSFIFYKNFNLNFVSDFGGEIGLSMFSVFMFFVGFGLFWRAKKFLFLYVICLILFLFCLKFGWVLIYLNLFLAILIAVCFVELFNRKWESNVIKNLTFLFLFFGLLFSGVSYAKTVSEDMPNEDFFRAFELIPDNKIVFSSMENGYWINYAGKKNVVDNFLGDFGSRYSDFNDILMLRDADIVRFLLDKYDVEYILVDNKMKKEIWSGEVKGLLWVVNYDIEHFVNIYDDKGINIWRYIRE